MPRLFFLRVWCRRGDSNPHELPHTPLKRARLPIPPLRLVREGLSNSNAEGTQRVYGLGCGVAVMTVENGVGAGMAVVGDAPGVGVATGASATPDCNTELVPVSQGSESINAISMKAAAAPIVIFANKLAVPRGPNAVLETELVNNAPASALPGCSNMTRIRTTHARINNPYKT